MSPFNYDENMKHNDDDNHGYWEPVNRKSSFSDINLVALSNARNSSNTVGYVKEFQSHLKNEKKRITTAENQRHKRMVVPFLSRIWCKTFNRISDDWLCLALLGIFMALLSVGVDKGIELCSSGKFSKLIFLDCVIFQHVVQLGSGCIGI